MRLADMTWVWPQMLWLLCFIPLAVIWIVRRSRSAHVAAILIVVSLGFMIVASARPQAVLMLPQRIDAVMLVLDVSGSMRADDITPSRIDAAAAAIRRFIDKQPPSLNVGLVTVAATATVAQMPTTNREALSFALDGIALQRGSALGSGIAVALSALLPPGSVPLQQILDGQFENSLLAGDNAALREGMAIVLLSDGADNMEPDIRSMARLAARYGVRVYTVGIGTTQGTILRAEGMSMRVRLEEESLKWVAEETSADYFKADSTSELYRIYDAMGTTIVFRQQQQAELTGVLLLMAVLCLAAGVTMSLLRSGRVI